MSEFDYDLFVIGAGSGGVRAARLSGALGLKVAIAESYRVGGTCVIRGCVPKKLMVYAADVASQIKTARGFGWTIPEARFDWARFIAAKDAEITRLEGLYRAGLEKAGVEIITGRAHFVGPREVEVAGRRIRAKTVLIAAGGTPVRPDIDGADLGVTTEEAFHFDALPKSVLVIGGGYIAVEFAHIFQGLGAETTLAYRGDHLLRGFDDEVRAHFTEEFKASGVTVRLGVSPLKLEPCAAGVRVHLSDGSALEVEHVLFATGRTPFTRDLGLAAAGVDVAPSGAVVVDAFSRTTAENVYAVGDVTDRANLTPVAIREAVAFVETAFKDNPTAYDHGFIPTAVFSRPEISTVGLTEDEARARYGKLDIHLTRFRPMKSAFAGSPARTLMKMIVDQATAVVVGLHVVGPDAAEMIQTAAVAVKAGLTKAQWDATCALHPTAAEELVTLGPPTRRDI